MLKKQYEIKENYIIIRHAALSFISFYFISGVRASAVCTSDVKQDKIKTNAATTIYFILFHVKCEDSITGKRTLNR